MKPSKSKETAAQRKERLAAERKQRLASQMPNFSLAGFNKEASSPGPAAPEVAEKNPKVQLMQAAEEPSDIFANFVSEDEAVPLVEETGEPTVPSQQDVNTLSLSEHEVSGTLSAVSDGSNSQDSASSASAASSPSSRNSSIDAPADAELAAPEHQANGINRGQEVALDAAHDTAHGAPSEERHRAASASMGQSTFGGPVPAQAAEVAYRSHDRRDGYSISVSQHGGASRRQRRPRVERFDPSQRQTSREEALRQLQTSAPRYSSLLVAYRVGQLSTVPHENRNVHLYGAAFEQLANQGTSDKALFMQLTGQRHKLTPAHYVDAVLEAALRPLDPMCVDEDLIEEEKDHVEKLSDMAFAYRSYILNNEYLAGMEKQRFTCTLRREVNTKVSRMMDLLSSMPTIKIQPFEIVSAVVADYLNGLPDERPHVESFFTKSTVTTYQ